MKTTFYDLIPEYLKSFSQEIQLGWITTLFEASQSIDLLSAMIVADEWLVQHLSQTPTEEKVMLSLDLHSKEFIAFEDKDEIVVSAVLADANPNSDGKSFTEGALISLAEKINDQKMALPDTEHKAYEDLLKSSKDDTEFISKLKQSKGMIKKVFAFVMNKQLHVRVWLSKAYKALVNNYKSVSIEAIGYLDELNPSVYVDAEPISFTFTNKPKIAAAKILSVE